MFEAVWVSVTSDTMMSICRRSFLSVFISCSGSLWMPTQQPFTKIFVALKHFKQKYGQKSFMLSHRERFYSRTALSSDQWLVASDLTSSNWSCPLNYSWQEVFSFWQNAAICWSGWERFCYCSQTKLSADVLVRLETEKRKMMNDHPSGSRMCVCS